MCGVSFDASFDSRVTIVRANGQMHVHITGEVDIAYPNKPAIVCSLNRTKFRPQENVVKQW